MDHRVATGIHEVHDRIKQKICTANSIRDRKAAKDLFHHSVLERLINGRETLLRSITKHNSGKFKIPHCTKNGKPIRRITVYTRRMRRDIYDIRFEERDLNKIKRLKELIRRKK